MTRLAAVGALSALAFLLTACGDQTEPPSRADDSGAPAASAPAASMPTAVPAASGPVRGIGTVLEADDGPQLCLGGVAESLPPQCGGPTIVNWSWVGVRGQFERAGGVRWGSFVVTGTFDGQHVTMTEDPITLALYDPMMEPPGPDPLATRCPEPDGGWTVVDRATTTEASLQEVMERAAALDGYGGAWLDQSINPASQEPPSEGMERAMNDPTKLVVNVLVTGDPATAEKTLREVWGGALCVTRSEHTEAELTAIQQELSGLPGLLASDAQFDRASVQVLYDDGSLQAWADATYGTGLVEVTSALEPVAP